MTKESGLRTCASCTETINVEEGTLCKKCKNEFLQREIVRG